MQQKHLITVQDEEQLWKNLVLGEQNPKSHLYSLPTLHFGLRGCEEHHEMFVEDFNLNRDDQGTEYVTLHFGNLTKTPTRRSKKETKSHPAKNVCHWRSPGVVQSSSSKHILPTYLEKCETVARLTSSLLRN